MISLFREATISASHIHEALPNWHECTRPHPPHDWTITLEASNPTPWSDDESAAIHVGLAEFEQWTAALNGTWLNDADESLHGRCDSAEVARWVYEQWTGRVPYLAAVQVGGPASGFSEPGWPPRPRRVRTEVEYRPAADSYRGNAPQ